jgi:adenylosuccinate synthase
MTNWIVTDLSYGDAGKGTIVDYLARQGKAVVVRHCGGPQAQHNVVTDDGAHHCFSQFGSGSLAGAWTYLSRYMLINPLNMMREAAHLTEMGCTDIWRHTYVDENAAIITPWHVAANRLQEVTRGAGRHGSCGQGVGVAMKQSTDMAALTIRVKDLPNRHTLTRLDHLRMYLATEYSQLAGGNAHWAALTDHEMHDYLWNRYAEWYGKVRVVRSDALARLAGHVDNVIFEGAQGALLDEWHGFHPYTTWSTTTHENALALAREAGLAAPVRLGVIRAVTTRHGPGPHPTEDANLSRLWHEPHNTDGPWQGPLRVGPLDLVAHRYAANVCGGVDRVAVTHLDRSPSGRWLYCERYRHLDDIPLGVKGDLERQERTTKQLFKASPVLRPASTDELLRAIETNIEPIGIVSHGPTAGAKQTRAGVLPSSSDALV